MGWDYEGKFLEQFPAHYRGAVGNEFCKVIREGATTPEEVLIAVCRKQTRYGVPSQLGELILREGVLTSGDAVELAKFLLWREALPWDEKQQLKQSTLREKNLKFIRQTMSEQPPTDKQLSYLKSLGYTGTPTTKLEASDLIEEYKSR